MPWLQPNNYTESLYLFSACVLHYNVERTKPGRPVFSPPALRLLNARVEKTGWTLHEFEKRGKGGEPFLSSADVKIAFKSFEDALVTFYLPDKPQSLDAQLLVLVTEREERKKKPGRLEKRGRRERAARNSTVLPAVSLQASAVKTP